MIATIPTLETRACLLCLAPLARTAHTLVALVYVAPVVDREGETSLADTGEQTFKLCLPCAELFDRQIHVLREIARRARDQRQGTAETSAPGVRA